MYITDTQVWEGRIASSRKSYLLLWRTGVWLPSYVVKSGARSVLCDESGHSQAASWRELASSAGCRAGRSPSRDPMEQVQYLENFLGCFQVVKRLGKLCIMRERNPLCSIFLPYTLRERAEISNIERLEDVRRVGRYTDLYFSLLLLAGTAAVKSTRVLSTPARAG